MPDDYCTADAVSDTTKMIVVQKPKSKILLWQHASNIILGKRRVANEPIFLLGRLKKIAKLSLAIVLC